MVGHEPVLERFGADLVDGTLGSAYVFVGPSGVGKRTCALWLARLLLCESRPSGALRPCDACATCRKVLGGVHPDVYEVTRQEKRTQIRMEQVREMLAAAEYAPFEGALRLFLLSEAEALNEASMNALLKRLEEPRSDQVFVLCVPTARALLPTILSRCRTVRFAPVAPGVVTGWLARRGGEAGRADVAAALCEGRPGYGLRLLQDSRLWQVRESVVSQAIALGSGDAGQAMAVADALEQSIGSDKSGDIDRLLTFLTAWYRDVMWLVHGLDGERLLNIDRREALVGVARRFSPERAAAAMQALEEARVHARRNVNPKLLFARLALRLRA